MPLEVILTLAFPFAGLAMALLPALLRFEAAAFLDHHVVGLVGHRGVLLTPRGPGPLAFVHVAVKAHVVLFLLVRRSTRRRTGFWDMP